MLRLTTPHNSPQQPTTHTAAPNHSTTTTTLYITTDQPTPTRRHHITHPTPNHPIHTSQPTPHLYTPLQRTPRHTPHFTPHHTHITTLSQPIYITNTSPLRPHPTQHNTRRRPLTALRILVSLASPGLVQIWILAFVAPGSPGRVPTLPTHLRTASQRSWRFPCICFVFSALFHLVWGRLGLTFDYAHQ